jgi:DNA mismatch repair protein MutL
MSDTIRLLPDHVASQIAAGEVVQRPSSVVKELLDNALDASSTQIDLYVKDAGKSFIHIVDNGIGLSFIDARACWERHATSKISKTEDLYHIQTMGFRGEALPSIASVAQVEMKTKRAQDDLGTLIQIEGSKVLKQEHINLNKGTQVIVKNLFYNIPARRNFLKSNPVEWKHILDEFTRAALANTHVGFKLLHNDDVQFDFGPQNLLDRVKEIFSDKKDADLIWFEEQTSIIKLEGFIGRPESAKRIRGEQFFFVNNRYFKDNYLNHAVNNAFEGMLAKEQFPFYIIFISIDPSKIDINVHPTKTEIKFEDEKNIYQILRAVVRRALASHIQVPEEKGFDDNQFMNLQLNPPSLQDFKSLSQADTVSSYRSSWDGFKSEYQAQRNRNQQNWELAFTPPQPARELVQAELKVGGEVNDTRVFFQLNNQFIVTPIKSGMMIIHQQAAHERILYEKYLEALEKNPIVSQQLLFPKVISLNASEESILLEILPEMLALGFTINLFGKSTFVINGLPAELHLENETTLISEIIETYRNTLTPESNKNKHVAKTLAKRAAIKSGTKLKVEEMNRLVDELFACKEPQFAPDGKPCVSKLTLEEISRMF